VRSELLKLWEKRSANARYVFESPRKPGHHILEPKKAFNAALADAGIENFRFHDLRHTAGTRLAELGVGIETIKDILGHADVRTTLIYVHAVDRRKVEAMQVLVDYAEKSGQKSPTNGKEEVA